MNAVLDPHAIKERIVRLAGQASIEISATDNPANINLIKRVVPRERPDGKPQRVFVASHSTEDPFERALVRAAALRQYGYDVVPHMAFRRFGTIENLQRGFDVLKANGITDALLIAGDNKRSRSIESVQQLAENGILAQLLRASSLKNVAFAGHPIGNHRWTKEFDATDALRNKYEVARQAGQYVRIVTQPCRPSLGIEWMNAVPFVRDAGNVTFGMLGPLPSMPKLAKLAFKGNFGLRQLAENALLLKQAYGNGGWPSQLLIDYAVHGLADMEIHIFTLGQVTKSAQMLQILRDGSFEIERHRDGFGLRAKAFRLA